MGAVDTYERMISPFTRAISEHVHGGPCTLCHHMEPCQQRKALVDLQDMAVQRWLEGLLSEPLGAGGQLLGPITTVILTSPARLADHGSEQGKDVPGEPRHG